MNGENNNLRVSFRSNNHRVSFRRLATASHHPEVRDDRSVVGAERVGVRVRRPRRLLRRPALLVCASAVQRDGVDHARALDERQAPVLEAAVRLAAAGAGFLALFPDIS